MQGFVLTVLSNIGFYRIDLAKLINVTKMNISKSVTNYRYDNLQYELKHAITDFSSVSDTSYAW